MADEHAMPVDVIEQSHDAGADVSLRDYVDSRIVAEDRLSIHRHDLAVVRGENVYHLSMAEVKRIDQLFDSKFRAYDLAISLLREAINKQFESVAMAQKLVKDNVDERFAAVSKSTDQATESLDKRLEGMNEFRQQMNDMAAKFITRSDHDSGIKYISERQQTNETAILGCITRQELGATQTSTNERLQSLEKFSNNTQGRMWVIAALVVVLEIAMRFIGSPHG